MLDPADTERIAIEDTQWWLSRAVVGLNLCPFAKAVMAKGQVRYVVTELTEPEQILLLLKTEMQTLVDAEPDTLDTTLLIAPYLLPDFLDFNEFLFDCEALLQDLDLEGVLQIADFHPGYQFAGSAPDDVENRSNQSPYPTLHLLREDSVSRAVEAFPDAALIYERNTALLREMGVAGWQALGLQARLYGKLDSGGDGPIA
jgi:hypothetical protein